MSHDYKALGAEIGQLVTEKQAAYGNSFGKAGAVMLTLYPNGISPAQMDDALCIIRIVDKLFRIATDRDALGESPYRDIAGYALLGAARVESTLAATERVPPVNLHVHHAAFNAAMKDSTLCTPTPPAYE